MEGQLLKIILALGIIWFFLGEFQGKNRTDKLLTAIFQGGKTG